MAKLEKKRNEKTKTNNKWISSAFKLPLKYPKLFLPTFALLIFNYFIFNLISPAVKGIESFSEAKFVLIVLSAIFFAVVSFFLTSLIIQIERCFYNKSEKLLILPNIRKWIKVFILLIIVILLTLGGFYLANSTAKQLGNMMYLDVGSALTIYLFILAITFFGIIIFFSVSYIIVALEEKSIWGALSQSIKTVYENYFKIAIIWAALLILYRVIGEIDIIWVKDLLITVLIPPFLIALLIKIIKK